MALMGTDAPGATPLSPDDIDGLIPEHITTRGELDEWEQQNILGAEMRLRNRGFREIVDDQSLRKLHRLMFGETWEWAGDFRLRETTIGVDPLDIPVHLRQVCDDMRFQRDREVFSPDELAARFHHRLVWVHPFRNGNGRHARLAADLLLESMGCKRFSWGRRNLAYAGEVRDRYIQSLRAADNGQYELLLDFVRS